MKKQFTTSVITFRSMSANPEVLLIFHKKFQKWMTPGGHVEPTENPAECALREVMEETGVPVNLRSFIHKEVLTDDSRWILPPEYVYEQIIPGNNSEPDHIHVDFTYIAFSNCDTINFSREEAESARWFMIDELNNLNMFRGSKTIILDAAEKVKHEEKKMRSRVAEIY